MFVQEEAVAFVFACECRLDAGFVFEEALVEFAGDGGVKGSSGAAEDVDVAIWHVCGCWGFEIRGRKIRAIVDLGILRDPSLRSG